MSDIWIVFDPLFGDGGKGAMVDYLSARDEGAWNVRFNGGAQCAHNVHTPDGKKHTFAMFGSGTLAGAYTYLSQYVRVDPFVIAMEGADLYNLGVKDFDQRMFVHEDCLICTPYHQQAAYKDPANHAYGSCFMGTWEAKKYADAYPNGAIYAKDLINKITLREKLWGMAYRYYPNERSNGLRQMAYDVADEYMKVNRFMNIVDGRWWQQQMLYSSQDIILEHAQGAMLDPVQGFPPYVTSTDCTLTNAKRVLDFMAGQAKVVAVCRTYGTRHGPGPFPTEDPALDWIPEPDNPANEGQGNFRKGWLDTLMLKEVFKTNPVDCLAISHFDILRQRPEWKFAFGESGYHTTQTEEGFIRLLELELGVPVKFVADGPGRQHRRER